MPDGAGTVAVQAHLERMLSSRDMMEGYVASSPEEEVKAPRTKEALKKSLSQYGVSLPGMSNAPTAGKTPASGASTKPFVRRRISAFEGEDEEELSVDEDLDEKLQFFSNHAFRRYSRADKDIIKEARRSAQRRKESMAQSDVENQEKSESEDEEQLRALPRTDTKSQVVRSPAVSKKSEKKPRRRWLFGGRKKRRAKENVAPESIEKTKTGPITRTDSLRHQILPEEEEESEIVPIVRTDSKKDDVRRRLSVLSADEEIDESEAESEEESEIERIGRTDSKKFDVKRQLTRVPADEESEEEEESEIVPLRRSESKRHDVRELQRKGVLDTEAEDSEEVESEEELESEAEVARPKKLERGSSRIADFLAEQDRQRELTSNDTEEEEEEEEPQENKIEKFLLSQREESDVEEAVESNEEKPTKYQAFLALNPARPEEVEERAEEKEMELSRFRKPTKKSPAGVVAESQKSKRASKSRKQTKRQSGKRQSGKRQSAQKQAVKKPPVKRATKKKTPAGYYDSKAIVKPSNVAVVESPRMVVQAWFNAFVALLISVFTFMKVTVLGATPVNKSNEARRSQRRQRPSSKRRSLKQS